MTSLSNNELTGKRVILGSFHFQKDDPTKTHSTKFKILCQHFIPPNCYGLGNGRGTAGDFWSLYRVRIHCSADRDWSPIRKQHEHYTSVTMIYDKTMEKGPNFYFANNKTLQLFYDNHRILASYWFHSGFESIAVPDKTSFQTMAWYNA